MKFSHFAGSGTSLLLTALLMATVFFSRHFRIQLLIEFWKYLSNTTSILLNCAPLWKTVSTKVSARSPNVFATFGFSIATTSVCPSMIRTGSSSRSLASRWSGQGTPAVKTSARTAFYPVWSCPFTSAKAKGTVNSSWIRLSRLTGLRRWIQDQRKSSFLEQDDTAGYKTVLTC